MCEYPKKNPPKSTISTRSKFAPDGCMGAFAPRRAEGGARVFSVSPRVFSEARLLRRQTDKTDSQAGRPPQSLRLPPRLLRLSAQNEISPLGSTPSACSVQLGRRFLKGTNLGINGLASADRSNKATLPLTTPRCTIKSSAKDLSLRIVKLQYADEDRRLFRPRPRCQPDAIHGPKAYSYTTTMSQG